MNTVYPETVAVATSFFDFASRHSWTLFPCEPGTKDPVKGVSWKENGSTNPAQWQTWQSQGFNLAIDCAKSGIIGLDVDTANDPQAWEWSWKYMLDAGCDISKSNNYAWSRTGAPHFAFKVCDGFDAERREGL